MMHWEGECVWVGGASPSPHPDRNSALGRQRSPGTERQRRADAEGLGWAWGPSGERPAPSGRRTR